VLDSSNLTAEQTAIMVLELVSEGRLLLTK